MIARVVIDRSTSDIDRFFDYDIPEGMVVEKGDQVVVPFGKKVIEGFCVDIVEKSEYETKQIISVKECRYLNAEMVELMLYMRKRFFLKYIDMIRLFIPSALRTGKAQELRRYYVELNHDVSYDEVLQRISKRSKKQKEIVELLKEEGKYYSELTFLFGTQPIEALIKLGLVEKTFKRIERVPLKDIVGNSKSVKLTEQQVNALKQIFEVKQDTVLLQGVTGSGKTVVYIEAIKKVLAEGKSAIMLVPEISLTPQMLNNFRGVFGNQVAMLHSGLSEGERFDEWKKLYLGDAKIVIGARSAIFAPLKNIGLIVVDEEHDSSYISESNPRYRAIEVAKFRAKYNNAKVILGSATPSIESFKKAKDGEYALVKMPNRISDKGMPKITIVDMKNEVLCGNNSMFSRVLHQELKETFDKGEQAMLLINRLGFSSFVRCRKCGYVPKCLHCDVALSYHKNENKLVCHYCGAKYSMLTECPECHSHDLQYGKIGTERVVEELNKLFPNVKALKLDSDSKKQKLEMVNILQDFSDNKAQVLVGTQMIAKGHDFSNVTLVGLVDADLGLYQQDFRSNERTFQLVTQMSGRAGRAEKEGKVVLQTYSPSNYVYKFATEYDYENFYRKEINIRETTMFPPFISIVRLLIVSRDISKARNVARELYKLVLELKRDNKNIRSMAGMESPINKINNGFRFQIVLRINKENELIVLNSLYEKINNLKKDNVSIFVEQDPQSLM